MKKRDTSSVKALQLKNSGYGLRLWVVRVGVAVGLGVMGLVLDPAARAQTPQNLDAPQLPATVPNWLAGQNPMTNPDGTQNGASQQNGSGTTRSTRTLDTTQRDLGRNTNTTAEDRRNTRLMRSPEPPTEFQLMVAATTGRRLPIFGASLFAGDVPTTFAPVDDIPVAPDYVIGPGDELRLQVWGQVNQQGSFLVDRTGSISVPQMGTIHVAGQRYDQLNEFLRNEFGRVYRNFNLTVTMGQLRSIQVFVVGAAREPGSYTISSLSTLLNALFTSGGPLPQGSLRDIQVRRGSQTLVHFDLYDLLLHGDKSRDIPLSPGDVIFIPPVGPQVALVGSVNNPAIYELKKDAATTVVDLLDLGGGRTSSAAGSVVRLERIVDRAVLSAVDVDLSKPDTTSLQGGDIVSVTSMVDRFKDAVTLRGNVANPGRYVWHSGMRISDLIPNKEALVTRDYWQKRNELGQLPFDYPQLAEYPSPSQYPQPSGYPQTSRYPQQTSGYPQQPAGYPQPGEYQSQIDTGATGGLQVRGSSMDRTAPGGVARAAAQSGTGGSSVASSLTNSGGIFQEKTDVVLSAPDINWSYAVIERQNATNLATTLIPFSLGKMVLDGDQSQNLELLPGDVVTIFSTADLRVPTSQQTRFVRLEGEFIAAGVYSVRPGETLRQLLIRAGGLTSDAYLYGSEFTRQSTKRVEQLRLNEYADQLEAQVSAETSNLAARAVSDRDSAAASAAATGAQAAIARLRRIEPIGRIVLELKPDSRSLDDVPDLALEDGDRFVVPRVPSNVNVEGQVYSANAFVFERGRRVRDYLKLAGGPSRQADSNRTFVVRADGSVYSRQYGDLQKALMFPGDTIVVPMLVDKKAILRTMVDIATVVGQFGIGAAAIEVLK